ncbi:MAG TPA: UDP-N-acetylglucosamine 1-carboxyvinyltransferase [Candidatus Fraserbacteria bacterium]|nr:UDP-N-acetylglucosamine 1-carboxyvinyltransferase [Candidatus Fraserbacteria bacterium]
MHRLCIRGGRPLRGRLQVEGAKNSALKLLVASLLTEEELLLENVPENQDVRTMTGMLRALGQRVDHLAPGRYRLSGSGELLGRAPYELVRLMRDSFTVLGPLLARLGRAEVPLPGGCNLGPRPVNFHLSGLRALGAQIELVGGVVQASARRLHGAEIRLDYPSVGATAHLLMTAALIPERTLIQGAAQEPEITDLIQLLGRMGAAARRVGQAIEIRGATRLGGARQRVIPDRVQAGSYALAAAISGGELSIGCRPDHLRSLIGELRQLGMTISEEPEALRVRGGPLCRSLSLETRPYPGFATDFQPQMTALLSLAPGESRLRETVFPSRFGHVPELLRLGADISAHGDTLLIRGVEQLQGARVRVSSICAGEALVLAALAARGETIIEDEGHLQRRYNHLARQLAALGADVSYKNEA